VHSPQAPSQQRTGDVRPRQRRCAQPLRREVWRSAVMNDDKAHQTRRAQRRVRRGARAERNYKGDRAARRREQHKRHTSGHYLVHSRLRKSVIRTSRRSFLFLCVCVCVCVLRAGGCFVCVFSVVCFWREVQIGVLRPNSDAKVRGFYRPLTLRETQLNDSPHQHTAFASPSSIHQTQTLQRNK
jgi:hypothetical protein